MSALLWLGTFCIIKHLGACDSSLTQSKREKQMISPRVLARLTCTGTSPSLYSTGSFAVEAALLWLFKGRLTWLQLIKKSDFYFLPPLDCLELN